MRYLVGDAGVIGCAIFDSHQLCQGEDEIRVVQKMARSGQVEERQVALGGLLVRDVDRNVIADDGEKRTHRTSGGENRGGRYPSDKHKQSTSRTSSSNAVRQSTCPEKG